MFENVSNKYFEEKMMWVGVLRRAIFDYVLYKGKSSREIRWKRAHRFIFAEDRTIDGAECSDCPTFEEICGMLGWEPSYLRRIIKNLDRTDIRKLESTKFKEDFRNEEAQGTPELFAPQWEATNSTVPFFAYLTFSREYHHQIAPKPVPRRFEVTPPPLMVWSAA